MTSSRPYILRALYEWIVDNEHIPYIVVDATVPGVAVPQEHVKNGQITLNIAPHAVHSLSLGNADIRFSARFSGRPWVITIPTQAVLAIYDRDTGQGMGFPPGQMPGETGDNADNQIEQRAGRPPALRAVPSEGRKSEAEGEDEEPPPDDTPPARGGHLRRIK
ncbi:MAG: ClpXP protease specificity-enhancing factor [Pseudomonadota bacterium]